MFIKAWNWAYLGVGGVIFPDVLSYIKKWLTIAWLKMQLGRKSLEWKCLCFWPTAVALLTYMGPFVLGPQLGNLEIQVVVGPFFSESWDSKSEKPRKFPGFLGFFHIQFQKLKSEKMEAQFVSLSFCQPELFGQMLYRWTQLGPYMLIEREPRGTVACFFKSGKIRATQPGVIELVVCVTKHF